MPTKNKNNNLLVSNMVFAWIAVIAVAILLIPLIAMQFSTSVNWSPSDFIIMGLIMFITGSVFVLLARSFPKYKLLVGVLVALAFIYIWVELAVGIFFHFGS